ncbi:MAG: dolichyl-phosphate beta-D-mannosyltransferase [Candidatus Harrisonbacteria bacterium CG10_big_fil_rev_8_21_14_0_10_40_38]|uniref:Dolichyl-phosphate beta-D-mannosyltransferase n=1 Tax=Candidatus Harrisonbacteria bacterium CG10_big_fil_rev_8_21_14_0_10_40_38 TaxID=1974583 RepID=A0A2H0USN4_9BACT|nr:MAG: dolichyl-phosphate beta-D-mannosyltransferase [Candidatus Harrisonbacteria bacterium CG10_big_fil_rev_8_21_14_0_10_40_38]
MENNPKTTIVICTYNESKNIVPLIEEIEKLNVVNHDYVIIDDNSPDKTGEIIENLKTKYPITPIHRKSKLGLGSAYIESFKKIIEKNEANYIVQLDADWSHDPNTIPKLIEKMTDFDLALGSRYIPEGKIENWNFIRRTISSFANWGVRKVLKVPYHDLTGGFKCYKKEVLKKIDLNSISSTGYNFQIETTYLAHLAGFKICEIPITFTERRDGESKFNIGIMLESFIKVLKLRKKHE